MKVDWLWFIGYSALIFGLGNGGFGRESEQQVFIDIFYRKLDEEQVVGFRFIRFDQNLMVLCLRL